MDDMSSPRIYTPGDGRFNRQGTSLLYIAGEKTKASVPWGIKNACTIPYRRFLISGRIILAGGRAFRLSRWYPERHIRKSTM